MPSKGTTSEAAVPKKELCRVGEKLQHISDSHQHASSAICRRGGKAKQPHLLAISWCSENIYSSAVDGSCQRQ